jgi:N-acetylglucosaminyldiphosphoundecaprenol N-acetyl-beta-D-mannosaminyltransferase
MYIPNVDHLLQLKSDPDFVRVYADADIKARDSQLLIYAARILGMPVKQKISGSDPFPVFSPHHRDTPLITIFLLGAKFGRV